MCMIFKIRWKNKSCQPKWRTEAELRDGNDTLEMTMKRLNNGATYISETSLYLFFT